MISSAINLGRSRGEIEDAKKLWVSARAGHRDPEAAGFWEMSRAADIVARAMQFANARPKDGRLLQGVPDDVWAQAMETSPLVKLNAEHLHVFLPEARETSVRSGCVYAKINGRLHAWREPELLAALGTGFAVVIKFDPAEPSLGAAVFNRESQNASANRWGWAVGQFLGLAEFEPEAPQIMAGRGLLTAAEEESLDRRKRYLAAVRAEYRAVFPHTRRVSTAAEARNGRGEITRVERQVGSGKPEGGSRNVKPPEPAPVAAAGSSAWRDPLMAQFLEDETEG